MCERERDRERERGEGKKRPRCWERLKAEREQEVRGLDGWMVLPIQWTYELGQTLGDGEGQGGLLCCSPRDRTESDTTWRLNKRGKWQMQKHMPESRDWAKHRSTEWEEEMKQCGCEGDEGKRRCGGHTVVQSLRDAGGGCVEPETGKKPHSAESTNTHVWGWQVY